MIEKRVNGVPVIMTEFGYKTFSMVTKSIGYYTRKTSPTMFRTSGVMETIHGQPEVSPNYPIPSINYIINLYRDYLDDRLDTVVISPGLEIACYLGRVLNAPVIPSQYIASAPDLPFIERRKSETNIYIVGYESNWPNLCVWIKPLNLGSLYSKILRSARNILLLSLNCGRNNIRGTKRAFVKNNISVINSNGRNHYSEVLKSPEKRGYLNSKDMIPHWEFAMDDQQIVNLRNYCSKHGIRLAIVNLSDWSCFIPALAYAKFYKKNKIYPLGITFHKYWGCHPFYESEFNRIPIYRFQYGSNEFLEEFEKLLNDIPFKEKNGEYLIWTEKYSIVKTLNPITIFESWGFPTRYKTKRPYDIWQFRWNNQDDPKNPTKEWVIPKLKERGTYKTFKSYLSFDEIVSICKSTPKTNVTIC